MSGGNDTYTVLLIHSDTTDGSTTFADSSVGGSTHPLTGHGDTHHETDQSKFGNSSIQFDGSGDYLTTPDSSDFAFGTNNFTIDFWAKRSATGATHRVFGQIDSAAAWSSASATGLFSSSDIFSFIVAVGSTPITLSATTTVNDTNWHHFALVRDAGNLYLFLDGTLEDTYAINGSSINDSSEIFTIGRFGDYTTDPYNGYIDEFRVSKNIARWSSNFTPPTEAYYITNSDVGITGVIGVSSNIEEYELGVAGVIGVSGLIKGKQRDNLAITGGIGVSSQFAIIDRKNIGVSGAIGISSVLDLALTKRINVSGTIGISSDISFLASRNAEVSGAIGISSNLSILSGTNISIDGGIGVRSRLEIAKGEDCYISGGVGIVSNVIIESDTTCTLPTSSGRWT